VSPEITTLETVLTDTTLIDPAASETRIVETLVTPTHDVIAILAEIAMTVEAAINTSDEIATVLDHHVKYAERYNNLIINK
jgi:hypothetical protein